MTNNKKTSILAIYEILKKYSDKDHCLKQKEIIAILNKDYDIDIDRRTLYSNMNYLTEFGYDISKYHEGNVGYYLKHRNFKSDEIYFLCNILYASTGIPAKEGIDLSNKLLNQLSVYEREKFNKYNLRINNIKTYNKEYFFSISKIIDAIESRSLVSFTTYRNVINKNLVIRKISKKSLVCPLSIVYHRERIFLITCDKNGSNLNNYRLSSIKDMEVIGEVYNKKIINEENLKKYKTSISFTNNSSTKARLKCNINLLDKLIEYFDDNFDIIDFDDHYVEVVIKSTEKNIIELVLHFVYDIELVEPGYLRLKIKNILLESLKNY
jgi:predicted DNA-binding transcriptional regulator YafY